MKRSSKVSRTVSLAAGVIAVVSTVGLVVAQPSDGGDGAASASPSSPPREGQRPGRTGGGGGAGGRVDVDSAMKSMSRNFKQLQAQLADASKKDDTLRLLNEMQRACVACKGAPVPAETLERGKDDAAKAAITLTYRKDLLALLKVLVDVEIDIMDGKMTEAARKFEGVGKLRTSSHEALGVDD